MPMLSQPAFGPKASLGYITAGALIDVWVGAWYLTRDHGMTRTDWFWVAGLFLTGFTLLIIGLTLGSIGRAARKAELPPPDATATEAAIQQTAAAAGVTPAAVATPVVAAGTPVAPAVPAVPAPAAPTVVHGVPVAR